MFNHLISHQSKQLINQQKYQFLKIDFYSTQPYTLNHTLNISTSFNISTNNQTSISHIFTISTRKI